MAEPIEPRAPTPEEIILNGLRDLMPEGADLHTAPEHATGILRDMGMDELSASIVVGMLKPASRRMRTAESMRSVEEMDPRMQDLFRIDPMSGDVTLGRGISKEDVFRRTHDIATYDAMERYNQRANGFERFARGAAGGFFKGLSNMAPEKLIEWVLPEEDLEEFRQFEEEERIQRQFTPIGSSVGHLGSFLTAAMLGGGGLSGSAHALTSRAGTRTALNVTNKLLRGHASEIGLMAAAGFATAERGEKLAGAVGGAFMVPAAKIGQAVFNRLIGNRILSGASAKFAAKLGHDFTDLTYKSIGDRTARLLATRLLPDVVHTAGELAGFQAYGEVVNMLADPEYRQSSAEILFANAALFGFMKGSGLARLGVSSAIPGKLQVSLPKSLQKVPLLRGLDGLSVFGGAKENYARSLERIGDATEIFRGRAPGEELKVLMTKATSQEGFIFPMLKGEEAGIGRIRLAAGEEQVAAGISEALGVRPREAQKPAEAKRLAAGKMVRIEPAEVVALQEMSKLGIQLTREQAQELASNPDMVYRIVSRERPDLLPPELYESWVSRQEALRASGEVARMEPWEDLQHISVSLNTPEVATAAEVAGDAAMRTAHLVMGQQNMEAASALQSLSRRSYLSGVQETYIAQAQRLGIIRERLVMSGQHAEAARVGERIEHLLSKAREAKPLHQHLRDQAAEMRAIASRLPVDSEAATKILEQAAVLEGRASLDPQLESQITLKRAERDTYDRHIVTLSDFRDALAAGKQFTGREGDRAALLMSSYARMKARIAGAEEAYAVFQRSTDVETRYRALQEIAASQDRELEALYARRDEILAQEPGMTAEDPRVADITARIEDLFTAHGSRVEALAELTVQRDILRIQSTEVADLLMTDPAALNRSLRSSRGNATKAVNELKALSRLETATNERPGLIARMDREIRDLQYRRRRADFERAPLEARLHDLEQSQPQLVVMKQGEAIYEQLVDLAPKFQPSEQLRKDLLDAVGRLREIEEIRRLYEAGYRGDDIPEIAFPSLRNEDPGEGIMTKWREQYAVVEGLRQKVQAERLRWENQLQKWLADDPIAMREATMPTAREIQARLEKAAAEEKARERVLPLDEVPQQPNSTGISGEEKPKAGGVRSDVDATERKIVSDTPIEKEMGKNADGGFTATELRKLRKWGEKLLKWIEGGRKEKMPPIPGAFKKKRLKYLHDYMRQIHRLARERMEEANMAVAGVLPPNSKAGHILRTGTPAEVREILKLMKETATWVGPLNEWKLRDAERGAFDASSIFTLRFTNEGTAVVESKLPEMMDSYKAYEEIGDRGWAALFGDNTFVRAEHLRTTSGTKDGVSFLPIDGFWKNFQRQATVLRGAIDAPREVLDQLTDSFNHTTHRHAIDAELLEEFILHRVAAPLERIVKQSGQRGQEIMDRIFDAKVAGEDSALRAGLSADELRVMNSITEYFKQFRSVAELLGVGVKPEDTYISYIRRVFREAKYSDAEGNLIDLVPERREAENIDKMFSRFLKTRRSEDTADVSKDLVEIMRTYGRSMLNMVAWKPHIDMMNEIGKHYGVEGVTRGPLVPKNGRKPLPASTWKFLHDFGNVLMSRPGGISKAIERFAENIWQGAAKRMPWVSESQHYKSGRSIFVDMVKAINVGALGMNPASAIRNLTDSLMGSAEIGYGWWTKGALRIWLRRADGSMELNPLLKDLGVMESSYIRTVGQDAETAIQLANRSFWDRFLSKEKRDDFGDHLLSFFKASEFWNRASIGMGAYYKAYEAYGGSKAHDVAHARAMSYAREIIQRTQGNYSRVLGGLNFSGSAGRFFGQFARFSFARMDWMQLMFRRAIGSETALRQAPLLPGESAWAPVFRFLASSLGLGLMGGTITGFSLDDTGPFGAVHEAAQFLINEGGSLAIKGAAAVADAAIGPDASREYDWQQTWRKVGRTVGLNPDSPRSGIGVMFDSLGPAVSIGSSVAKMFAFDGQADRNFTDAIKLVIPAGVQVDRVVRFYRESRQGAIYTRNGNRIWPDEGKPADDYTLFMRMAGLKTPEYQRRLSEYAENVFRNEYFNSKVALLRQDAIQRVLDGEDEHEVIGRYIASWRQMHNDLQMTLRLSDLKRELTHIRGSVKESRDETLVERMERKSPFARGLPSSRDEQLGLFPAGPFR